MARARSWLREESGVNADVVVVEAGIIGAATARELARAGVEVVLVDAGDVGTGSSGRCDGNLLVQGKHDVLGIDMMRHSLRRYGQSSAELDIDLHFRQHGRLVVCTDDDGAHAARQRVEGLRSHGVRARFLESSEVADAEPGLSDRAVGGIDCAEDRSVYPPAVVAALVQDARRHGCTLLTGTTVRRILASQAGTVGGVETDRGVFAARFVVNAMGARAADLEGNDGVHIPVEPRQGVLAVTDAAPGLVRRPVSDAAYLTTRASAGQGSVAGVAFLAEPTFRGNVLLASSRRFCGYDMSVDIGQVSQVMRRAVSFLPALADIQIVRTFAGLRPWTPGNRPIIGPSRSLDGYLLATGHEGEGIGLAPVTSDTIAALVTGAARSLLIDQVLDACDRHRFPEQCDCRSGSTPARSMSTASPPETARPSCSAGSRRAATAGRKAPRPCTPLRSSRTSHFLSMTNSPGCGGVR
jgi:sarcosine oxidase subunit beta